MYHFIPRSHIIHLSLVNHLNNISKGIINMSNKIHDLFFPPYCSIAMHVNCYITIDKLLNNIVDNFIIWFFIINKFNTNKKLALVENFYFN